METRQQSLQILDWTERIIGRPSQTHCARPFNTGISPVLMVFTPKIRNDWAGTMTKTALAQGAHVEPQ